VLQEHEGQSPDFVRDKPEGFALGVPYPPPVIGFGGEHVPVGLATRHASSGASGIPRPVKVERRRQKKKEKPARGLGGRALGIQTLSGGVLATLKRRRGD
jgi:hypothetical protein